MRVRVAAEVLHGILGHVDAEVFGGGLKVGEGELAVFLGLFLTTFIRVSIGIDGYHGIVPDISVQVETLWIIHLCVRNRRSLCAPIRAHPAAQRTGVVPRSEVVSWP